MSIGLKSNWIELSYYNNWLHHFFPKNRLLFICINLIINYIIKAGKGSIDIYSW